MNRLLLAAFFLLPSCTASRPNVRDAKVEFSRPPVPDTVWVCIHTDPKLEEMACVTFEQFIEALKAKAGIDGSGAGTGSGYSL